MGFRRAADDHDLSAAGLFVIVLLFPFYWMAITAFKPDYEMYDYKKYNPFWVHSPTLANIDKLLFDTDYPHWLMTTMGVAIGATFLSLFASVLAAYAIERLRFKGAQHVGLAIYLAYLVPPIDPVHSAGDAGLPVRPVRQSGRADPDLSDLPGAVLHLAADRLFQVDPV